jgi:predicted metal-dependent hydrolase
MSWNGGFCTDKRTLMSRSIRFTIVGVGEVLVEQSDRTHRLRITVRPSGVRVAVPRGLSLSRGMSFALAEKEWIRNHIHRMDTYAKAHAEVARYSFVITDMKKAREKIVKRLHELSALHGLPYGRVMVRKQRTRWGSCSTRGTISLNIKLARLPQKLMDYVILHELLHTRIRGHAREFWRALDALVGDAGGLRKELRSYCLDLSP